MKNTHVRFEPEVDNGTTYAFNFHSTELVIGRKKMHHLIFIVSNSGYDLESLFEELIDPSAPAEIAYSDRGDLLVDLIRLVDANILEMKGEADVRER